MSKSRHFPAYDFDCDDCDVDAAPEKDVAQPQKLGTAHRRIRTRRVAGDGPTEKAEMLIQCPFLDRWPTFDECLGCEHWRGYSLDPSGKESFMSCARAGDPHCHTPLGLDEKTAALRTKVNEVMSDPICVSEDMGLDELAALFVDRGISSAPVIDGDGKPIGVVSKTDLVEARAGRIDGEPEPDSELRTARGKRLGPGFQEDRRSALTAANLMTPVVFSLPESASVAEAASLMAHKGIHGIPIASRSGDIVGVLTSLDIARWLDSMERNPCGPRAASWHGL